MATAFYLISVALLVPIGAFSGFVSHLLRANFSAHPERLLEERGVLSTVFNDAVSKESLILDRLLGGEWDSMGYWDAHSTRNILLYVVPGAVLPLIVGVFFFPQHAEIVANACQLMRGAGLHPPMCPAA